MTSLIGAAGSLLGGVMGSSAADKQAQASLQAAQIQAQSQREALAQQQAQWGQTQQNIAPFLATGTNATNQLTNRLADLTSPINMNQAALQQTPGYQFNLTQGLKATQSAAAARGLGVSGAALKGAASYATGLADNTYQNQFNNANTNQTNAYNRLYGTAALGANAAVGQGTLGQQNANAQSAAITGAGTAQASGIMGAANANMAGTNALTGGLTSAAYGLNGLNFNGLTNMFNGGGSGMYSANDYNKSAANAPYGQYGPGF